MKQIIKKTLALMAVLTSVALTSSAPLSAQEIGNCLSNVDGINAANTNQILPLADALNLGNVPRSAKVTNPRVCFVNGQLAYIVNVNYADGSTAQDLILRGSQ